MYYCNSRYYSPELCRFITPLDYSAIDSSNKYTLNRYAYCYNSPIVYKSYENSFKATVSNETNQILQNCLDGIKSVNDVLKDAAQAEKEKLKEKANTLMERTHKLYANFKSKYDKSIDKLEQFINYPDVALSTLLSKMFNKDINIRFRLINLLREKANLKIDLSFLKNIISKENSLTTYSNIINNVADAIVKTITIVFELKWLDQILNTFNSSLEKMAKKSFERMQSFAYSFVRLFNATFNYISSDLFTDVLSGASGSYLEKADDYLAAGEKLKGVGKRFGLVTNVFSYVIGLCNLGTGSFSAKTDFYVVSGKFLTEMASMGLMIAFPESVAIAIIATVIPYISNILIDFAALTKENKFFV